MKRGMAFILLITILAFSACTTQPAATTDAVPQDTTLQPTAGSGAEPDDFTPVIGEVLETGPDYIMIDDLISCGKVKLLLNRDTRYPVKGKPDTGIGNLFMGETAVGWMKSLPPQAILKSFTSCVPAVKVTGEIIEAGTDRILIKDGTTGEQMALLISGDTFFPEGLREMIKPGLSLEGYRAEEVMESYPPQARLLAVKSCK